MVFTVRMSVYDTNIPRAPSPSRAKSGRKVKKKEWERQEVIAMQPETIMAIWVQQSLPTVQRV